MMTNNQCYSYAAKAISDILKSDCQLTPDTLYSQLRFLWNRYSEEGIEKLVRRLETKRELF